MNVNGCGCACGCEVVACIGMLGVVLVPILGSRRMTLTGALRFLGKVGETKTFEFITLNIVLGAGFHIYSKKWLVRSSWHACNQSV